MSEGIHKLTESPRLLQAYVVSDERVKIFLRCLFDTRLTILSDGSLCQHCVCTCCVFKRRCTVRVKEAMCGCARVDVFAWVCQCLYEKQRPGGAERHSKSVRKKDMNKQIDE